MMPRHNLNPENHVRGAFTLDKRTLKFRSSDAAMVQRLKAAKAANAEVTVCLFDADPMRDFTGRVESVELVAGEKPACWAVTMRDNK